MASFPPSDNVVTAVRVSTSQVDWIEVALVFNLRSGHYSPDRMEAPMGNHSTRRIELIAVPLIAAWFCMVAGNMRRPGGLNENWLISLVVCAVGIGLNFRFTKSRRYDGILSAASLLLLFTVVFQLGGIYTEYILMREGMGDTRIGIYSRLHSGDVAGGLPAPGG